MELDVLNLMPLEEQGVSAMDVKQGESPSVFQMALEACEKGASEVCVPAPMWRRLPGQQEVEPLPVEMVEWWRSWEAETGKWTPVQLLAAEVEAQRSERRAITARIQGRKLQLECDIDGDLQLHWAVWKKNGTYTQWGAPSMFMRPRGTRVYSSKIARTPFVTSNLRSEPRAALEVDLGRDKQVVGIRFIIQDLDGGVWYDNAGSDFVVEVQGDEIFSPTDSLINIVQSGLAELHVPDKPLQVPRKVWGVAAEAKLAARAALEATERAETAAEELLSRIAQLEDIQSDPTIEELSVELEMAEGQTETEDVSEEERSTMELGILELEDVDTTLDLTTAEEAVEEAPVEEILEQFKRGRLNFAKAASQPSKKVMSLLDMLAANPAVEEEEEEERPFENRGAEAFLKDFPDPPLPPSPSKDLPGPASPWPVASPWSPPEPWSPPGEAEPVVPEPVAEVQAPVEVTPQETVPIMVPSYQVSDVSLEQELAEKMKEVSRSGNGEEVEARPATSGTGTGREILLQGFNWESNKDDYYTDISSKAAQIKELGFTQVWLPPPTNSVSDEGYMPRDLYDLNSKYGNFDDLKQAISVLHDNGLSVLADAVLNHRCAAAQSPNGCWNVFGGDTGRMAWGPEAVVADDPNFQGRGGRSSGDFFTAAPNIDHSQDFVRRDICEWMRWLRDEVNYDGYRLDFVRGFWGGHVKEYLEASSPSFAVGEFWDSLSYSYGSMDYNQDAHRQRIIDWINAAGGLAGAFDVTTKGILHSVFGVTRKFPEALSSDNELHASRFWRLKDASDKPPGVMGWWPSRAVTFLENHDTGSTQGHWRFPAGRELEGYVYILTHPGTPSVFYDHVFYFDDLARVVKQLIEIRKRNDINCRSQVHILQADNELYAAIIDDKLLVKLGPGHYQPPHDGSWECMLAGHSHTVWERR
ncbi:alpha-amylase [Cymbomonas tetramitiformis]|uniref:alpha-amylase n=1 Tax=Cymbomonas tetramitiformis TaxID=36881 RepID=A0AAE0ER99_9CHLO|nr:alpha-amylase [Cymbomonas tetramitiformis]